MTAIPRLAVIMEIVMIDVARIATAVTGATTGYGRCLDDAELKLNSHRTTTAATRAEIATMIEG